MDRLASHTSPGRRSHGIMRPGAGWAPGSELTPGRFGDRDRVDEEIRGVRHRIQRGRVPWTVAMFLTNIVRRVPV